MQILIVFLMPIGFIVGLLLGSFSRNRLLFHRAYIEICGDVLNDVLAVIQLDKLLCYSERKVDVQLIESFEYTKKNGDVCHSTPFVRVSMIFLKTWLDDRLIDVPCESLTYLENKFKKFNIASKGYF